MKLIMTTITKYFYDLSGNMFIDSLKNDTNNFITTIKNVNIDKFKPNSTLFKAKDCASILGYKNKAKAIRDHVDIDNKIALKDVFSKSRETLPLKNTPDMVFINRYGLYDLVMNSKLPQAKSFKLWVYSLIDREIEKTVIPKNNDLVRSKMQFEIKQMKLEIAMKAANLFQMLGMDDRDKLLLKDYGRDIISNQKAITDPKSEECSISKRVNDKFSHIRLSVKSKKKLYQSVGRKAAREYRNLYNKEPITRNQYVDGTIRKTKHYIIKDFEDFIDAIINDQICNLDTEGFRLIG